MIMQSYLTGSLNSSIGGGQTENITKHTKSTPVIMFRRTEWLCSVQDKVSLYTTKNAMIMLMAKVRKSITGIS